MWLVIIIVGIILLIAGYVVWFYNRVMQLKIGIENTHKQIEVAMKKRFDMIGQLIDVVKAHMKFEKGVMIKVTKLRAMPLKTMNDIDKADDLAKSLFAKIVATVENYPNLRSIEAVKDLTSSIRDIESEIARLRYLYNDQVQKLNTTLVIFPNNILARLLGLNREEFLRFKEEIEKAPRFR